MRTLASELEFYVQRYLIFVANYINKIETKYEDGKKKSLLPQESSPGRQMSEITITPRGTAESYLKCNIHSGTLVNNAYQLRLYGSPPLPKRLGVQGALILLIVFYPRCVCNAPFNK